MSLRRVDGVLAACFAAVVATFVGATVYTQHRTLEIERAALSIESNAAPSIRRLANARAELRRLQLLVHRALADGTSSNRTLEIESGRALLEGEVGAYRTLPRYPGETAAWRPAESALSRVEGDVTDVLDGLGRADRSAALVAQGRMDTASEEAARALSVGIDANVAAASRLAGRISASRQRAELWAIELNAAGVVLAVLAATLALRSLHAHARAIVELQHAAERKAGELDAFATRMAHDIRNPLTTANLVFDDILRGGAADERLRRSAMRGSRAVAHTTEVIEGLLEFARAGARPTVGATASPAEIAEEVVTAVRARAEQVGAEVQVIAASRARVACGRGMLASVLGNLVGNALTYVDGGPSPRVEIRVEETGAGVRVAVCDSGPGLPPGLDPAALFQPYVRGPGARGRGLGLGLATVSRIIDAHGGHMGVESSSSGATFWLVLPRAADKAPGDRGAGLS